MSFQFRYTTVLRTRIQSRDRIGRKVAEVISRIANLDRQLIHWQDQIDQLQRTAAQSRTGVVTIVSLSTNEDRSQYLHDQRSQCQHQRDLFAQQLAEQRELLIQAQLDVKRLEVLRDKDLSQHRSDQQRAEQRENDDRSNAARYVRQNAV